MRRVQLLGGTILHAAAKSTLSIWAETTNLEKALMTARLTDTHTALGVHIAIALQPEGGLPQDAEVA